MTSQSAISLHSTARVKRTVSMLVVLSSLLSLLLLPASVRADNTEPDIPNPCTYVANMLVCTDTPQPGCMTITTPVISPGNLETGTTQDIGCPSGPPPNYVPPPLPINAERQDYKLNCWLGQQAHVRWYANRGSGERIWWYTEYVNGERGGANVAYLFVRSNWAEWNSYFRPKDNQEINDFSVEWSTYVEVVSGACI